MANRFDYPPLPIGVSTFNPRRFRRYYKKQHLISERDRLLREKRIEEAERKATLRALHEEQKKVRALVEERDQSFVSRVKRFFSRRRS